MGAALLASAPLAAERHRSTHRTTRGTGRTQTPPDLVRGRHEPSRGAVVRHQGHGTARCTVRISEVVVKYFRTFLLTARHEDMEVVHLRAAFVCCIRHDSGSVSEKLVRLVRFFYPLPTEIHLSAKNTLLSPIEISRIYAGMVCLSWTLRP